MPVVRPCSFCGNDIDPGTGMMFIKKDGTVFHFCSSKCRRNLLDLGRVPRWTRWTLTYQRAKGKAVEAAPKVEVAPTEEAVGAVAPESQGLVTVEAPKGKVIPADVVDLIDRRLGPDLPRAEAEHHFGRFVESETLRVAITPWHRKRHPGKHAEKVEVQEFLAFLETSPARKTLKGWLDDESKRIKSGAKKAVEVAPKAKTKGGK